MLAPTVDKKSKQSGDKYINMEIRQEELAEELKRIVLQIEILTGRIREISKEIGFQ